jgi:hypothetical protein
MKTGPRSCELGSSVKAFYGSVVVCNVFWRRLGPRSRNTQVIKQGRPALLPLARLRELC